LARSKARDPRAPFPSLGAFRVLDDDFAPAVRLLDAPRVAVDRVPDDDALARREVGFPGEDFRCEPDGLEGPRFCPPAFF
jgi:hypothetical protein